MSRPASQTVDKKPLSKGDRDILKDRLAECFEDFGLQVGLGSTKTGIVIRSQDHRVDCANLEDDIKAFGDPARLKTELVKDGWRCGKDNLWRNDRFGGSYSLLNAVKRLGSKRGEVTGITKPR